VRGYWAVLIIVSILVLGTFTIISDAAAQTQPISTEMEGYFNILEIMYEDGSHDRKYYLFVDDGPTNNQIQYQLSFTNPNNSLMDLVSENVVVRGQMLDHSFSSQSSSPFGEVQMMVDSIEKVNNFESYSIESGLNVEKRTVAGQGIPSPLKSYTILTKFANVSTEPHNTQYFSDLFYDTTPGTFSMRNFWYDASYGALDIVSAGISDWETLPKRTNQYFFTSNSILNDYTVSALANAGAIDFNGADNIIQNSFAGNLQISGDNGDDIDQLVFIFNAFSFSCTCAFAFTGPVPLSTSQGLMYFYLGYNVDTGSGFAVGPNYFGGIGVPAHEMGHNLNWNHTPTPPPHGGSPYQDPWSLLSRVAVSTLEDPAGPISYQRDHAKWIPSADIITVSDSQGATFTLDILSASSPGPNYLMASLWDYGGF